MIRVAPGADLPDHELELTFVRSSGPGGQNVNKTSTKAVLRWNVRAASGLRDDVKARFLARYASRVTTAGDVLIASDRSRDQGRNAEDCIGRLVAMLAEVAKPPVPRVPTRPGRGARERRLGAKKSRSGVKTLRGRVSGDSD